MNLNYNISGMINAESVDDAMDVLQLTLDDVTSTCKVTVSGDGKTVSERRLKEHNNITV